jgi:hypothetical protein
VLAVSPQTLTSPTPRAQTLSRELASFIRERRAQDPRLDASDLLTALDLTKASVLREVGVAAAAQRMIRLVAILVALVTAGMMLFIFHH